MRIARASDNGLVWMVPASALTSQSPLDTGSTSVSLGTSAVSGIPLVKGSAGDAKSLLNTASTSDFVATLDGLDNTLEISPDNTHWVSIPITEAGANTSTFIGTIGFDFTAVRVTTNSSTTNTTIVFSDATGTSTITISGGPTTLSSVIGTGSVVRVSDGIYSEIREVTSVSGSTLSVTKLSNTSYYTPWKTWVQVIGNDMDTGRGQTLSSDSVIFRIGGYKGATYRIRYNDAVKSDGSYAGGDTHAITTTNVGFQTYTGEPECFASGYGRFE